MLAKEDERYKTFLDLYEEVFECDGTVKVCTRKMTSKLIAYANKNFGAEGKAEFGNDYTGMMDIDALNHLYYNIRLELGIID
jgi:hypothetical protein